MKRGICALLVIQAFGLSTFARVLQTTSNATLMVFGGDLENTTTLLQTSDANITSPQETSSWALSSEWGSCRDSLCDPTYPGAVPIHIYDQYVKIVGHWRPLFKTLCIDLCDMTIPIPGTGPPLMVEVNNTKFSPASAVSKASAYELGRYDVQMDMTFVQPGFAFTIEANGWVRNNKVRLSALINMFSGFNSGELNNSTSRVPDPVNQPS